MKPILKKILKIVLIFLITTSIVYAVPTAIAFNKWCKKNNLSITGEDFSSDLRKIDKDKIQNIGNDVSSIVEVIEMSVEEAKKNPNAPHSIGEYFDPLGYSVWSYMQMGIDRIFTSYTTISILFGIGVTIAYIVITNKKMNNIIKFSIGYFGVMLIIPPIYMYSYTYRFWSIAQTYSSISKYFYIGYTTMFILMYVINYTIGTKMTKELNENIKNK